MGFTDNRARTTVQGFTAHLACTLWMDFHTQVARTSTSGLRGDVWPAPRTWYYTKAVRPVHYMWFTWRLMTYTDDMVFTFKWFATRTWVTLCIGSHLQHGFHIWRACTTGSGSSSSSWLTRDRGFHAHHGSHYA